MVALRREKDAVLDRMLEILRRHRLPPWVEICTSWTLAIGCLAYYGCNYILFGSKSGQRVPLLTSVDWADGDRLLAELAQKMGTSVDQVFHQPQKVIELIRNNIKLRKIASDYLMSDPEPIDVPLYQLLMAHKVDLYRMPSIESPDFQCAISLVIPSYKEHGRDVQKTLQHAARMAGDPAAVQVIVVDAGCCQDLQGHVDQVRQKSVWGSVELVDYRSGGGRGPTLNAGAQLATGRLLTFLHSDTLLPEHWDTKVIQTLGKIVREKVTHACAFSFGHNLSKEGLGSLPFPYGISAVDFLGNLRAWLFKLPYGDHVISIPTKYFRFVGGFPDQPIMEDYQLMDVLRQRAASFLPERLEIIHRPAAQCSVRRWQMFGVVYTTLVNLLIVYRYRRGWSAQEIFDYYYQRPFSKQKRYLTSS